MSSPPRPSDPVGGHGLTPFLTGGASLTEAAMDYIRTAMVGGVLRPGELYSVYQFAADLQVSRSPVRDALLRLEEAGLIRFHRNRGFEVVATSAEDIVEIFALRLPVEVAAARRAARLRDSDFAVRAAMLRTRMTDAAARGDETDFFTVDRELHEEILAVSALSRGARIVGQLRVATRLLGASTAAAHARSYEDIVAEHDPVVDAIVAGDVTAAGAAMHAHLESTGRLLLRQRLAGESDEAVSDLWHRLIADFRVG